MDRSAAALLMAVALVVVMPLRAAELAAGPMPGHSAMRAVKVWLQTDSAADVEVEYWPLGDPTGALRTGPSRTSETRAFTATIDVTGLAPGRTYAYRVVIDGRAQSPKFRQRFSTQPLWQWRSDPPDLRFALGSCAYVNQSVYDRPGKPYGSGYRIFDAIADVDPDFMLWLGDNVYYREVDWDSESGMYARFSHTRQLAELQRLLAATHHYATWDDHDYGPNNADRSYAHRSNALEVFDAFWPNPDFDAAGTGGVTNHFEWHDAAFFLLDNRFFRQANHRTTGRHTVLGREQLEWLIDALKSSHAAFRFVVMGGQFLNSAEDDENYINLAPGERRELLDRIDAEDIPGVVFLTGDRHHSVLMRKESDADYPLYDWTVSPLTAGPSMPGRGEDQYRVEGSLFTERNFGVAEITGPRDNRVLRLGLRDSDGNEVWSYRIHQRDLR